MRRTSTPRLALLLLLAFVLGCTGDGGSDAFRCETARFSPTPGCQVARARRLGNAESPWRVGEEVKVLWRMVGTGDFQFQAIRPDGEILRLHDPGSSKGAQQRILERLAALEEAIQAQARPLGLLNRLLDAEIGLAVARVEVNKGGDTASVAR